MANQPEGNEIITFFHCARCVAEWKDVYGPGSGKLESMGVTPQHHQRIEVGWTARGLQVWCWRHKENVLNLDFQGTRCKVVE